MMSAWTRRSMTALATCGLAAGSALLAAPAAHAANPTPLPSAVSDEIARNELPVQVSNGWEAVTGPARSVNEVRDLATSLDIGTVAMYTGDDETGRAILIFTGDDQTAPTAFDVTGGTVIRSVDNDTDQAWYVYDDHGVLDATVPAETAQDIPPADAELVNAGVAATGFATTVTVFSF